MDWLASTSSLIGQVKGIGSMLNFRGMGSNAYNLGKYALGTKYGKIGAIGLGLYGLGLYGMGKLGHRMDGFRNGVKSAFTGSTLGSIAGMGVGFARGGLMAGRASIMRAGMYGAGIGLGLGAARSVISSNRPVNPIRGFR